MELETEIIDDSNLIIQLKGKKILLAIGSNYSLSNERSIAILEKNHSLENQYMGFSLKDVNAYLDTSIDYVIGSDILSNYNYRINSKDKLFLISDSILETNGENLPLNIELDIPSIEIQTEKGNLKATFDSVSKYCYVHSKNSQGKTELKENEDFAMGIGPFSAKIFNFTFKIAKYELVLETGIYPSVVAKTRNITPEKAVLGNNLIQDFIITLNCTERNYNVEKL